MDNQTKQSLKDLGVDAQIGNRLIQVKTGVAALRSVRLGLMQLAYAVSKRGDFRGFLVLIDTSITHQRLQNEWQKACSVLRPDVADRLALYVINKGILTGLQREPDQHTRAVILDVTGNERTPHLEPRTRADASFVVPKVLMLHWLTDGGPTTVRWLSSVTGYSYPTIARVLKGFASLIERRSDRRIRLRGFPREDFARVLTVAPRARGTVRFADRSGQARTVEAHLRRLEKLNPPGIALGGVPGAKHYFPDLDLVGVPRLDVSLHSPRNRPDLRFIEKLDPALKRIQDPHEPATVVVHVVRHADPFFTAREGGLNWADQMECLLDLYEAGLQKQASEFLGALTQNRSVKP